MKNFDFTDLCFRIGDLVWSAPMLFLLIFVGIIMTVGTKFFQITHFSLWMKTAAQSLFSKKTTLSEKTNFSRFQALCTALASTIGTGNIIGTATAISTGGAGAVFWMWVSALLGMMTAYSENVLGILYRRKQKDGSLQGGPMYYIQDAFPDVGVASHISKVFVYVFCISCVLVSFGMGNMIQSNSISSALWQGFGISPLKCGIILSLVIAAIVMGGTKMVGKTTEKIVPFMAILYVFCSIFVILLNYGSIPSVFANIITSAFSFRSVVGGGAGNLMKRAVSIGFRRGLCSNEAGLGSAVLAHSASDVKEPAVQGMMGIFVVFIDTIIICTLTAIVLLSSSCYAMPFEDALKGITKEERLVYIDEDIGPDSKMVPIMNSLPSSIYTITSGADAQGKCYTVSPRNGVPFDIYIKKENSYHARTHTGVMSIRGVSLNSHGEETEGETLPVNAVKLESIDGLPLVTLAFSQKFGFLAGYLMAMIVFLFAFSSIVGWSFYGLKAWKYIFKNSSGFIFKIIFSLCVFLGANMRLDLVWSLSDIFNALMAFPNLIALIFLCPRVFKTTRDYIKFKVQ